MEQFIQILFLAIMSIGILGLPLYLYLNARRKRILSEFEQNSSDSEKSDENE